MSYYALQQGTNVYEAAAGLGAIVRTQDARGKWIRQGKASQPWSIPFAYSGFGGIEFSGSKGWADQTACDAAWQATKTTVPQCKTWVNLMRAGLAQLGYGQLGQSVAWGAADIAAYKAWCAKNSMTPTTYPTKDGWTLMETQVNQGIVTGDQPPVEMVKSGDTFVPAGTVAGAGASKGVSPFMLGLIAVGLIGVGAIAIAAKRRKGGTAATPVSGPLPSPMKANFPRRRKQSAKYRRHLAYVFKKAHSSIRHSR